MSPNPFVSARVTNDLFNLVQARCKATGEFKSEILVKALTTYLGSSPCTHPEVTNKDITAQVSSLESLTKDTAKRLRALETEFALVGWLLKSLGKQKFQALLNKAATQSVYKDLPSFCLDEYSKPDESELTTENSYLNLPEMPYAIGHS